MGSSPSTGSCGGGRPRSTRSSSATGSARRAPSLAPINPNFTEPEARSALETLRPRLVVVHPEFEDAARAVAEPLGLPVLVTGHGVARRRRVHTAPPRSARARTRASSSSPAGRPGCRRARCSRTAPRGCAPIQRDNEGGATERRGVVVMFGLFHMAGWTMIEGALAADRPVHLVHRPDPHELLGAIERWRASGLYCIPGVWQRILDDDGTYDTSSLVEALTGTSLRHPRPHRRAEGALPGFVDVGRVRLHRDRSRRGAARLRSLRPARQRRATATDGRRRPRRRRRAVVARPHDVLRLPRPTRRHRRGDRRGRLVPHRRPRRRATPTATSPSPGAARSRSGRAASGWRRSRSRPPSSRTPRSTRSAWSGSPTRAGARSCARRSW